MSKTIDRLIINTPYDEPQRHWFHDPETQQFSILPHRRSAGYIKATPNNRSWDDPGEFVPIPLVNKIRPRVKDWRQKGYAGATSITRRLLQHWQDLNERQERRFFFCQLEAIETLIWLTEAPAAERVGITVPSDGGEFPRWCSKMATGSGKTVVMAMLIAWQGLNKVAQPRDGRFSKAVFVVAPNLTVKKRLQVLQPSHPNNYYEAFNIVPASLMPQLRQILLKIDNWHSLAWDSQEQLDNRYSKGSLRSVDRRQRMEVSPETYIRQRLGELASAKNLIVINDEAHHAWRVNPRQKVQGVSKEDKETATIWINGLDRIHQQRGILQCFDLSATPFAPSGKKAEEEALFSWVVSDFGLNDAIESGLVKTPRVVVREDKNKASSSEQRSKLYHLYTEEEVRAHINQKAASSESLPDLLVNAYYLLGLDWQATKDQWAALGHKVPPVMMTVANRVETAARIQYAFANGHVQLPDLCDPSRMLRIDNEVLKQPQTLLEKLNLGAQTPELEHLTKVEQRRLLQKVVDTVGKKGELGEAIQNVISVGMLSEGWDAQTVTHIMGLRAFSSQLLCEQVIGRGLRRVSYEVNEAGYLEPEYVNIFGVPFSFLPHEGGTGAPPRPPKPKIKIGPVVEKIDYQMSVPNVARLDYTYRTILKMDWEKLPTLQLPTDQAITRVALGALIEGRPSHVELSDIELEDVVRENRLQTFIFEVAKGIVHAETKKDYWKRDTMLMMAQLVRLVQEAFEWGKIQLEHATCSISSPRGQSYCLLHRNKIVQHIWDHLRRENLQSPVAVYNQERPQLSTSTTRPWHTSQPAQWTQKSHISHCVHKVDWTSTAASVLDESEHVAAFVKNDHFGFGIHYLEGGLVRRYLPNYIVKLVTGDYLILAVAKRRDQAAAPLPKQYLDHWVNAINGQGRKQRWHWAAVHRASEVDAVLAHYVALTTSTTIGR